MTKRETEEKIRRAYDRATPDVWDSVLADCKGQKGRALVVEATVRRKTGAMRLVGLAACLCLVVCAVVAFQGYRAAHAVYATVSLDVNPSIEIQVDREGHVLGVSPLNEDGEVVVGGMDFSGSDLDVAVTVLVGSMLQNGYLNELANSVLISVDSDDPVRGAALQDQLTAEVDNLLQTDAFSGAVLSQTVARNDELQRLSEKHGITIGKAQLVQTVLSENPIRTFDDLASLSVNELNLLLSPETAAAAQVEVVGIASDKAYIGEARAKEIAVEKAGVSADSLMGYEIELDADRGALVYDIEFSSGDYEYDCEIDAATGAVVEFEKESLAALANPDSEQDGNDQSSIRISPEEAREIVLGHAGVEPGDVYGFKSELDLDGGVGVYELEFWAGGCEYDYEISATSGAVLKSGKEAAS